MDGHQRAGNRDTERRLEASIVERFSAHGVLNVYFIGGFTSSSMFWSWIAAATDQQRDALIAGPTTAASLRSVIDAAGLSDLSRGFTIESQETVDRDYEGSWFYRLR